MSANKVEDCIAWASQQGFAFAAEAAIEHGKAVGKQAAWKDNGLYNDFIIFLPEVTDAERVVQLDWQGKIVAEEGRTNG